MQALHTYGNVKLFLGGFLRGAKKDMAPHNAHTAGFLSAADS